MASIEGMAALITGGGSGIGLASAVRLAEDGANITICGRTESKLVRAIEQIKAAAVGGEVTYVVADVTDEAAVAIAVQQAATITGRLDVLFCCAGGSEHLGSIASADVEGVRTTIELNMISTFLCVKHAVPYMARDGGGSIITMSAGAGVFPHRYLWAYGMAKAGIDMFTKSAAEELGPYGIRVNSIQPGLIDDELMSFITKGGPLLDDYVANTPLGRIGTVNDVAELVRYLAGPESSWVTGGHFPIDGGHHLRRGADYGLLFGH